MPSLYLIPVNISEAPLASVLPAMNTEVCARLRAFVVENVRTARRFLRHCSRDIDIDAITFRELNGHTPEADLHAYLDPLRRGEDMGLMSEAGCPCVADPGAKIVAMAQREGFRVVPLVGPSSILLSLMGSGFNGQGFAFNGYLPIDKGARTKRIKELEMLARKHDQTQIFIETPYRNEQMLRTLAETLHPSTPLCVATDLTDPEREQIVTHTAAEWRKAPMDLRKRPAIFLIYHS